MSFKILKNILDEFHLKKLYIDIYFDKICSRNKEVPLWSVGPLTTVSTARVQHDYVIQKN